MSEHNRQLSQQVTPESESNEFQGVNSKMPPALQINAEPPGDHGGGGNPVTTGKEVSPEKEATGESEEIKAFKAKDYGPITYTHPSIGGSGFQASYKPSTETLTAEVRGKVRFADTVVKSGTTYSSPNHFMQQSQLITFLNAHPTLADKVLPYFQWKDNEKEVHKIRFLESVSATSGLFENAGFGFQVNQAGWEGVKAKLDVNINITEGAAVTNKIKDKSGVEQVDTATSDHLQVEIVKQVNSTDTAAINKEITDHIATLTAAGTTGVAAPGADSVQKVRSYMFTEPSRSTNPKGFRNFMSLRSNGSDNPETQKFTHEVRFAQDQDAIAGDQATALDTFLNNPMVLVQNPHKAVNIRLQGFAASADHEKDGQALAGRRIGKVSDALNTKMATKTTNVQTPVDPKAQTNHGAKAADADKKGNPGHKPEDFRKVAIEVEQEGRGGQNTFAHEMGHVFGLGDEYVDNSATYNRPAGTAATHSQLAIDAGVTGGSTAKDDDRLMSTGSKVGAAHLSTFADALKQLTSKPWKIV